MYVLISNVCEILCLDGNTCSSRVSGVPDPYMQPPKAYLDMLDRAARLPPFQDMPETDPLSSVLSQQKSITEKYVINQLFLSDYLITNIPFKNNLIDALQFVQARDKQKLKVKMEKDLETLWNYYKDDEKKRKMQSGEECSQDVAMPAHERMICFICETWLRPACKHLYFCSRCNTKSRPCPSCLILDRSS